MVLSEWLSERRRSGGNEPASRGDETVFGGLASKLSVRGSGGCRVTLDAWCFCADAETTMTHVTARTPHDASIAIPALHRPEPFVCNLINGAAQRRECPHLRAQKTEAHAVSSLLRESRPLPCPDRGVRQRPTSGAAFCYLQRWEVQRADTMHLNKASVALGSRDPAAGREMLRLIENADRVDYQGVAPARGRQPET